MKSIALITIFLVFALPIFAAEPIVPDGQYLIISSFLDQNQKPGGTDHNIDVLPCHIDTGKEGTFVTIKYQNPNITLKPIQLFIKGDNFYFAITPSDYTTGRELLDLSTTTYRGKLTPRGLTGIIVIAGWEVNAGTFILYKY